MKLNRRVGFLLLLIIAAILIGLAIQDSPEREGILTPTPAVTALAP